jgi:hypothetical protein
MVQCIIIDTVVKVGITPRMAALMAAKAGTRSPLEIARAMYLSWERVIAEHISNPYYTLEDRDDAYWKTLIAKRNKRNRLAGSEMKAAFNAWRKGYCLGGYSVEEVRDGVDILSPPDEIEPFASAHRAAILTRLPFVTNGKKTGITLLGVEGGDILCLIYGTNVPFVLQRSSNRRVESRRSSLATNLLVKPIVMASWMERECGT